MCYPEKPLYWIHRKIEVNSVHRKCRDWLFVFQEHNKGGQLYVIERENEQGREDGVDPDGR